MSKDVRGILRDLVKIIGYEFNKATYKSEEAHIDKTITKLNARYKPSQEKKKKRKIKEPYQPPQSNHLTENLIAVGYYKHEIDFGVRCDVYSMPKSDFDKLLKMLDVAVKAARDGWAREHAPKQS